jgi:hypothetical protein
VSKAQPSSNLSDPALRLQEIERVRGQAVVGESGRLKDLFDYLVARMDDPRPPKEAEIGVEVFGRSASAEPDPSVRVYIHRLRRKLDDFYRAKGSLDGRRLAIPKGEYRLVIQAWPAPENSLLTTEKVAQPSRTRNHWLLAGLAAAALLAANIAAWAVFARPSAQSETAASWVLGSPVRSQPLLVVVGDYYIFGEFEDRLFLRRLVRDFSINSPGDLLARYGQDGPEAGRYADVSLRYLPTSAAHALAGLAPILARAPQREVVLASELTPERLKQSDVLYVGLLSGLGVLKDPVFASSAFSIGDSFDDIIDEQTGEAFRSEAFLSAPGEGLYRDYAFFSTFEGPAGNRITILAGTRDTGLLGLAEWITNDAQVRAAREVGALSDVQAVLEVRGQRQVSLETRVVAAHPIDSDEVWRAGSQPAKAFPVE